MFIAGVILTHAVFYFDRITKKKKFYLFLSATILQVLDNINLVHQSIIEIGRDELKTMDVSKREEYLDKESKKLSIFMELYVLLFIKSVPLEGRRYIKYKTWPEAKALIQKLRGFINDEQSKG
ncbi:MAG: hypothetical protein CMC82_02035 [Flavobacteriaceae bacterium]|nr:hypothetical protein [Flavobacteriaceae bacterium]